MKILSVLIPCVVCFISRQICWGFVALALQVSIVGWPIATLIAFISAKKHNEEIATNQDLENFTRW